MGAHRSVLHNGDAHRPATWSRGLWTLVLGGRYVHAPFLSCGRGNAVVLVICEAKKDFIKSFVNCHQNSTRKLKKKCHWCSSIREMYTICLDLKNGISLFLQTQDLIYCKVGTGVKDRNTRNCMPVSSKLRKQYNNPPLNKSSTIRILPFSPAKRADAAFATRTNEYSGACTCTDRASSFEQHTGPLRLPTAEG
jgi:hypothetical protein